MDGDILNLIARSLMEIKFYITFISNTFLIRLTVESLGWLGCNEMHLLDSTQPFIW